MLTGFQRNPIFQDNVISGTYTLIGHTETTKSVLVLQLSILERSRPLNALSPTGSRLARTDLSPLTNGIWEIHA